MLMFALMLSIQAAPVPGGAAEPAQSRPWSASQADLYAPPVVRPYEPPSDFGRQIAEGDDDLTVRTRPIAAPVGLEAYGDAYEARPTPREVSYQQGIETARQRQNERMGPLDGNWQAVDGEGQVVFDLVLSDRGATSPVEGGLRLASNDRTHLIYRVAGEGDVRTLTIAREGRPLSVRLHRQGDAWAAEVEGLGRDRRLTLVRPQSWAP